MLPSPLDSSKNYVQANVDTIKQAIYSYGVISAAFAAAPMSAYMWPSSSTASEPWPALYDPNNYVTDHAIVITGWDDNYAVNKFMPGMQPPGPGAFLIQNSWGSTSSHFWISYYDHTLSQLSVFDMGSATASSNYNSPYDWTTNYSNDALGMGSYLYFSGASSVTFANKFTATSTSALRAAQVFTWTPGTTITVSAYLGATSTTSPISGATQAAIGAAGAMSVSQTATYAGYQTVAFPTPALLTSGQPFSIVVTESVPSGEAQIPIETYHSSSAGVNYPAINANESYILSGSSWLDLVTNYSMMGKTGTYGNVNLIGLASPLPTYTLTLNANGGTVSPTTQSVTFQKPYGTLQTPTRSGYTFNGWFTAASGGTQVTSTTTYTTAGNSTIYAQWTVIPPALYVLTFNPNGGSVSPTSVSLAAGAQYGTLPTPTRSGYTFNGWFTAASGGSQVFATTTMVASAVTIYAQWTVIPPTTYVLTFNPNGGSVSPTSISLAAGAQYGTLPTPTRSGYTFNGWFTASSSGSQVFATTTMAASAVTIYAQWTVIPPTLYVLTFNPNGGSVSPASVSLAAGAAYGTLPTPTRSGYTWIGWYTAASGGTQVFATTTMAASNVTIYAQWALNPPAEYLLTYDPNGGSVWPLSTALPAGAQYGTLPVPTRDGYTFNGWFTAASGGTQVFETTVMPSSAVTIYAQWTATPTPTPTPTYHVLTFAPNGGTVSPTSKTVATGDPLGELPTPVRSGYSFLGWFTDLSGGYLVTSTTTMGSVDVYLYAHWLLNPSPTTYVLTFNANGGSVSPSSTSLAAGAQYGALPVPTRSGYTFDGWFTAASGGSQVFATTTMVASNVTIYAQWTQITYRLYFNANGGSTTYWYYELAPGTPYGMLPWATRTGYSFVGWYTAPSGGTYVTDKTIMGNADTTIYVHWTANSYKVTFSANGGKKPKTTSKTVTMGKAYGTLPTTSRTNYSFKGWFTAKSGGTKVTSTTVFTNAANQTLYAHWLGKAHTVKLKPQGGRVSPASIKVNYKGKYSKLPTPTRAGYVFTGWYTKASGGKRVYLSSTVNTTKNQTLYAHWKKQ